MTTPSGPIPAGHERISLVRDDASGEVLFQVEHEDGTYLCDDEGMTVDLTSWTLVRVIADISDEDADEFWDTTVGARAIMIGHRIGEFLARDILAEGVPCEWVGLDAQNAERAVEAGFEPDTPEWVEMVRSARESFEAAITKANAQGRVMARSECRRCSECANSEHHWIEEMTGDGEGVVDVDTEHERGCDACCDSGVIEVARDSELN